jgi:hypothetical protein
MYVMASSDITIAIQRMPPGAAEEVRGAHGGALETSAPFRAGTPRLLSPSTIKQKIATPKGWETAPTHNTPCRELAKHKSNKKWHNLVVG